MSGVPAPPADVPASQANVPLNERQHWALDQLRGGAKLERGQVEKQFRIVPKTAKRDLSDLVKRGLVEFVRTPRPGFYRLKKK
jgi:predicted ArsR family transcriptional regulator